MSSYQIAVTKTPRTGAVNVGGLTFADATPIQIGTPISGTLHSLEGKQPNSAGGQFFKVQLAPGEQVSLAGSALFHGGWGGGLAVEVYSAAQVKLDYLINLSGKNTIGFPSTTWPKRTFTHNGSSPATYYLRAYAPTWVCHEFTFTIVHESGNGPALTMYLKGGLGTDPLQPAVGRVLPAVAYVPLGEYLTLALVDGSGNPINADFTVTSAEVEAGIAAGAMFSQHVAFRYASHAANSVVLQTVHRGTVRLQVAPSDASLPAQSVTVVVEDPLSIGTQGNQVDSLLLPVAHAYGYPPQFFKAHVAAETPDFNVMTHRYEPYGYPSDFRTISRASNYRRVRYAPYRFATAADTLDPALSQGALTTATDLATRESFWIDCNLPSEPGPDTQGRPVTPADGHVSAQEIVRCNDGWANWSDYTAPAIVASFAADGFTAQTSLASSYGLMQVTYVLARELKWNGNPTALFDTQANIAAGGGSITLGAMKLRNGFHVVHAPRSAAPDLAFADWAEFLAAFTDAWGSYNAGKNYRNKVASRVPIYRAAPRRPQIF